MFADTIDTLISADFRPVDLCEWVAAGRPPVDRGFALTFDDGLRSILKVADRLSRLSIPATVFLLSDRIGLDNAWPGQPPGIPIAPLLSRTDLDSLARLGFRFGSHGTSHSRFDQMDDSKIEHEMTSSRSTIEQMIGRPCPLLAYPYGRSNSRVRIAASKVYDAAFGTRLAYTSPFDDRFDIARIDAFYLRSARALDRLISGRWQVRLAFRRVVRSARACLQS